MAQMTWRMSEELLERVRRQAAENGRSLNDWVSRVMDAASDPTTAGTDVERIRERLAAAGVLERVPARPPRSVADRKLAAARSAAGRGTPLSELVRADR